MSGGGKLAMSGGGKLFLIVDNFFVIQKNVLPLRRCIW